MGAFKTLKKYKAKFNPDLPALLVMGIVDMPAHESGFNAFANHRKIQLFQAEKQHILGAAIIANKPIYRRTEAGDEYYIEFEPEEIEKFRNYFHENLLIHTTNLNHDGSTLTHENIMVESWIVSDPEMDKSKLFNLEGITKGTWMITYHVPDKQLFNKIKSGEYTGFSIESYYDEVLTKFDTQVEKEKLNKIKMSVLENMKNKFNAMFDAAIKQKFAEYKTADGLDVVVDDSTLDVTIDGVVPEDSDVLLDDGRTMVIASGKVVEIKEVEQVEEPAAEPVVEEAAKVVMSSLYASYELEDGKMVSVEVVEVNAAYTYDETSNRVAMPAGTYPIKGGGDLVIGADGKVESAPGVKPAEIDNDEVVETVPAAEASAELEKMSSKFAEELKKLKLENLKIQKMNSLLTLQVADLNAKLDTTPMGVPPSLKEEKTEIAVETFSNTMFARLSKLDPFFNKK